MSSLTFNGSDVANLEHDLHKATAGLVHYVDLPGLLEAALELVQQVTDFQLGYIELFGGRRSDGTPRWCAKAGIERDQLPEVRAQLRRGAVGEAVNEERSLLTTLGPSSSRNRIKKASLGSEDDAVLCMPIGAEPAQGILYLIGAPNAFTEDKVASTEIIAGQLAPLVERMLDIDRLQRGDDATLELRKSLNVGRIIGTGRATANLLDRIGRVSRIETDVFIIAPEGTEVEVVSRAIHDNSHLEDGPFISVDLAATAEPLEPLLFGNSKSQRSQRRSGVVFEATHGTLLIQNIQNLNPEEQSFLFKFLQTHRDPNSTSDRNLPFRVLCSAPTPLTSAWQAGTLSADLYYRLHTLTLTIPTLAHRRQDIGIIANHLAAAICNRHDLPQLQLSPAAIQVAASQPWPRNLEELEQVLEAAVFHATRRKSLSIESDDLNPQEGSGWSKPGRTSLREANRMFKRQFLIETLKETNWNFAETARRLEITRAHIYNLVNSLEISRQDAMR